ncbi:UDP binding domain-containing protein [Streptomyces sp. NPDC096033]|uniref:UDP binding domain-containing protein n=1 Tax=Streptomyces sp. NPDC096033 TaxID=3366071 RepID=UPI0037FEDA1C
MSAVVKERSGIRTPPLSQGVQLFLGELVAAGVRVGDPRAQLHEHRLRLSPDRDLVSVGRGRRGSWDTPTRYPTPQQALAGADAAVIVIEWPELAEIDWIQAHSVMRTQVMFDGRNLFDPAPVRDRIPVHLRRPPLTVRPPAGPRVRRRPGPDLPGRTT